MFHDPDLFKALAASRPLTAPIAPHRARIGPGRPAIAPLTMVLLGTVSLGLWGAIAQLVHLT